MKILLALLFLTIITSANEINLDNLLKKYQDSESLYKKTKQENAGFLLTYSREDLESMQAFKLKDIFKTIRMYTMQVNLVGANSIKKVGAGPKSSIPIKLYIDDFEVTSFVQENPLSVYGDMDIYFVDHIEVYQGGSSIAFGNEPGSMVVRLYSKDPNRENSNSIQTSIDSLNGKDFRSVNAGKYKDYNYLLYLNIADARYNDYTLNNKLLHRDSKRYQTHLKFAKKDNFDIEFNGIVNDSDAFKGLGTYPTQNHIKRSYAYLSATKYFKDDLKVSFSISGEDKQASFLDENGFLLANDTISKYFYLNANSKIYKAIVEKKFIYNQNDFLLGAQYLQKNLELKRYELENYNPTYNLNKIEAYMIYFEEMYNIDKNNLISCSGKLDYYKNNLSKSSTEHAIRLAYISIFNHWKSKIFAIRRYVYPNGMQTALTIPTYTPNTNLKSSTVKMLAGEWQYYKEHYNITFGYAYKEIYDSFIYNTEQKQFVNAKDTVYFNRVYIRNQYEFDIYNKIVFEIYKGYKENYYSSGSGGLIQMFNKIDKFNIYNELVYRDSFELMNVKMDAGYDWSLSIAYPVTKKIDLKFKGENILNKASKTLIDASSELKVPTTEKRFMLTMEYTF